MLSPRTAPLRLAAVLSLCGAVSQIARAQAAIDIGQAGIKTGAVAQGFRFVSDGPKGPGWTRPDEIARAYFNGELPAFFTRTITLAEAVPEGGRLSWIFTGPHAGFTVQLSGSKVRLLQRYYDSVGLNPGGGSYPEKITRDDEQPYSGVPHSVTVVLDSHLSVHVLLNGKEVLQQSCLFDVTRHQLMYSGARNVHHVVTGSLLAGSVGRSVVRVNGDERHQEMLGFGGSPSVPAYQRLSTEGKAQYWQMLKRYNLLIDREYPMGSELKPDLSNLDNLSEATPHYYGDNFPNGEISDFEYSKKALALGGFVVYEMWALPPWATQPFRGTGPDVIDAWGKAVRTAAKPDEYARAMVEYCRRAKERTGTAPAVLGIENEVEQPPEVFDAMVLTLRRELDRAGFTSTRIHMADASFLWMGIGRVKRLQHDPAVWKAIDYTASHEYDFQEFFANPDSFDARLAEMRAASGDKPFLATEICLNDPHLQEPSYRVAFTTGQLYQKNLTILDAASLMYCWLILDVEQPSFGGSRSLLVADRSRGFVPVPSSYELRVLGAFSRHVLHGMHRVGAKSSEADLLVAAFDGAGKSTLVAMNRSTEPQQLQTEWQGKHWSRIERTGPTLENVESSSVPGEVVVEPGEIVVLSTFAAS